MQEKQPDFDAFVHFGTGAGPFLTVKAPIRYKPSNQSPAKAGPLASHWELRVNDKWRRLFTSSGNPSHFVRVDRVKTTVQLVTKR